MTTRYELRIRNASGVEVSRIGMGADNSVGYISYQNQVNHPGMLIFTLSGDHPVISDLERNGQIEVWRDVDEHGWERDFLGLYVEDYDYTYRDMLMFKAYVPGIKTILRWGINAWKAAVSDRSKFASNPAETIAKTLVKYNLTSDATTGNGRELTWQSPFTIAVEADSGRGNVQSWSCAWDNIGDSLIDLASIGDGDFDLVRDSGTATKFQFAWYDGQLGTDRSTAVYLAIERENITNVVYRHRGSDVKTAVIVGGQGEEDNRAIVIRTSTDDGTAIHRESFLDATNCGTGDTMQMAAAGDTFLEAHRDTEEFEFDVLQTEATKYGIHYKLGDLVTIVRPHDGVVQKHKIDKVIVSVNSSSDEKITVKTREQ